MTRPVKIEDVIKSVREGLQRGVDAQKIKDDFDNFLQPAIELVIMLTGSRAAIDTLMNALKETLHVIVDVEADKLRHEEEIN